LASKRSSGGALSKMVQGRTGGLLLPTAEAPFHVIAVFEDSPAGEAAMRTARWGPAVLQRADLDGALPGSGPGLRFRASRGRPREVGPRGARPTWPRCHQPPRQRCPHRIALAGLALLSAAASLGPEPPGGAAAAFLRVPGAATSAPPRQSSRPHGPPHGGSCRTSDARICRAGKAEWDAGEIEVEIEVPSPFGTLPGSRAIAREFTKPSTVILEVFMLTAACALYAIQTLQLDPTSVAVLSLLEDVVSVAFIVEYFLRWYSRNLRPSYLLKFEMLVDLAAFLPFLLALAGFGRDSFTLQFLRLLRILRLQRFLRNRLSFSRLVGMANAGAVNPFELQLARTVTSISTLVFISSGLIYNAEHAVNPAFPNFFATLYFGLVTLTTVGYGDMVPTTIEGRFVVCLSILVGVATVPVELSKLAGAFMDDFSAGSDNSTDMLRSMKVQLDQQQAQIDAIAGNLGLPGPGTRPPRSCSSCGAAGHRGDAGFCFRCGAALPVQRVELYVGEAESSLAPPGRAGQPPPPRDRDVL